MCILKTYAGAGGSRVAIDSSSIQLSDTYKLFLIIFSNKYNNDVVKLFKLWFLRK